MGIVVSHHMLLQLIQGENSSHSSPNSAQCSPWTSPMWVLLAAVLHTGCSPWGTAYSSVRPPGGHKFCQQNWHSVGFCLHRSTCPASILLQCGFLSLLWASSSSGMSSSMASRALHHVLQVGLWSTTNLHGLQGMVPSPWSAPQVAGKSLVQHLERILLLLHWPSCLQSCFSHILSPLFFGCGCCCAGFFPLLNYVIPKVLHPIDGLDQWLVRLGPNCIGCEGSS